MKRNVFIGVCSCVALTLALQSVHAQEAETDEARETSVAEDAAEDEERMPPAKPKDIVVIGTRSEQPVSRIPTATTVISRDQIQAGRISENLEESLRRVPGIRVESELGEVPGGRTRIIMRGIGTRANNPAGSGIRGVRVVVDGIPKNNAGGSAQDLINIDLGSAERIEVIRGPSSALYGNQSGGVVNIVTESGPAEPFVDYKQVVGEHGLFRENLKIGGQIGDFSYLMSGYRTDADGFRQQSSSRSTGINAKFGFDISPRADVEVVIGFDRNTQESPGQLTREQFEEDPSQANPDFLAGNVFATVQEFRLGITYSQELFGLDDLEITGYYNPRRLFPFQRAPFVIPQDFTNRGVNLRYLNEYPVFGFANRFTVGFDVQDTPITTGVFGRPDGGTLAARVETATTMGFYLLNEIDLRDDIVLSLSGRFDRIRFTAQDLEAGTPEVGRTFTEWTPKVGLTYQLLPNISLYTNYAEGFETPIIGELRRVPGGEFGFNSDLDPQETQSYEIGTRGGALDDRISWELALFRQDIDDFISLAEGDLETPVFQNVTKVEQFGVELGTVFQLARSLELSVSYTFSDFDFGRFVDGDEDFSGNRLPGVPRHAAFADLTYRHLRGFSATVEVQRSGEFFVDDGNTAVNESYTVAHLRLAYDGLRVAGLAVSPFLGVNNITDEVYSQFAFLNEAQGRYFNPLPGINAFGGFSVRF